MQVFTYSDEYGIETFDYDTEEEAKAGYERLKKASSKGFRKDGIERKVILANDSFEVFRQ